MATKRVIDQSDDAPQSSSSRGVSRSDVGRPTLFLEPQPYRRRRLIDAARLLPVFGIFMLVVPPGLLTAAKGASTTSMLIYLVMVWAGMIFVAALLGRYMRLSDKQIVPSADVGPKPGPEA